MQKIFHVGCLILCLLCPQLLFAGPATHLRATCDLVNIPPTAQPCPRVINARNFTFRVFALDASENVATDYAGKVVLSNDIYVGFFYPVEHQFTPADQGYFTFTAALTGFGTNSYHWIHATDAANGWNVILEVFSDDPVVPYRGVSYSPTKVEFPPQAIGTTSAPIWITFTNPDDVPRYYEAAQNPVICVVICFTTPGRDDFTVSRNCFYIVLMPGASCSFSVTFSPTADGLRTTSATIYPFYLRGFSLPISGMGVTGIDFQSSPTLPAAGAPVVLTARIQGINPTGSVSFLTSAGADSVTLCKDVPLVNGAASCAVAGGFTTRSLNTFQAAYRGDNANTPTIVLLQVATDSSRASLSAVASPQPGAGQPVTLTALLFANAVSRGVTFYEYGAALPGCEAVIAAPLSAGESAAVATCTIAHIAPGDHTFVITAPGNAGNGFEQVYVPVNVSADTSPDFSGLWWAGAAENGWGIAVTMQGAAQQLVFYVYDDSGRPVWYLLPSATRTAGTANTFAGAVFRPHSAANAPFEGSGYASGNAVGSATITYENRDSASLAFTINGVNGVKRLQRQPLPVNTGVTLAVAGRWTAANAETGWGLNIAQQGKTLFPLWHTFDAAGDPVWYALPAGHWIGNAYEGDLYRTTSSPWLAAAYDPAKLSATVAGNFRIVFLDQRNAAITYAIGGIAQSRTIALRDF